MARPIAGAMRVCDHPLYRRWSHMRHVCYNTRAKDYPKVGGKGIKIGKEFEHFWAFVDEIETKLGYPEGFGFHTKLARLNQQADFTIKNMCWDNTKNIGRRHNTVYKLRYKGVTKPVRQWSEELGIRFATLLTRMELGWTPAQALGFRLGPRQSQIAKKQKSHR